MSTVLPDIVLIPYGTADLALEAIRVDGMSGGSIRLAAPFPLVAVNRAAGAPLRFNTARLPATIASPAAPGDLRPILEYLKSLCRPWDNVAVRFLEAYATGIGALLADNEPALTAALAPFAGLYDVSDWVFSAPLPLPRAHLHAPPPPVPGVKPSSADLVRVDFALWLGDRLVAARGPGAALTPKRAREQAERLSLAGIEVVGFTQAELAAGGERRLVERLLGPLARSFWSVDVVPVGPAGRSFAES